VAKANKNIATIKSAEETISCGLVLLSKLIAENLTFERECILTAFSLTPTDDLFKKVTELAGVKRQENFFLCCRRLRHI